MRDNVVLVMLRTLAPSGLLPWLVLTPQLLAQEDLSVRAAVEMALRSHPLLQAGTNRVAAAQGFRLQSALRPNPRAVFQTENWRWWGNPSIRPGTDPDIYLYGSQLFETAGKRANRMQLADSIIRRAELDRELTTKMIAARVKSAYWNAAGAQRVHELLLQTVAAFDQIVQYHENRVREGAMAEADLLKVRLERERVVVSANSAALDAQRARIQLFREMGQSEFPEMKLVDTLDTAVAAAEPDLAAAMVNRTEIKLAQQLVDHGRANRRLQQSLAKPDIEGLAGYKRTSGFDTLIVGAQVPLPFSNRNQGNIATADAEIRVAESELAATRAVVAAEVKAAIADVRSRERQLQEFFPTILQQARESAGIAQAAYREGGLDLLRLVDAERVRIDTEVLYSRTLAEYRQSLAALEAALGVM